MVLKTIQDIRREELLSAALEVMKRDGFQHATIEKIARQAGASKGIVHHYFKNKQELIESTMRHAHSERRDALIRKLRKACNPSDRVWAAVSIILDEKYLQPGFCKAWVSFHAECHSNKRLARLQRVIHRRERSNLVQPLKSFLSETDANKVAIGIKALIEGFRFRLAGDMIPDFDSNIAIVQVLEFLRRRVPGFDQAVALKR
ncbi:MAG TPA: transcriptional regulator BetI [Aestuariivirgaceae bacterium]|jgi:TetR/AcrR family transcriptional repressor of bet genes